MPPEEASRPIWDSAHLRLALEAAGVGLWSWNIDTDRLTMDERAFEMWGVTTTAPVAFADLSAKIHPEDLDRVSAGFAATRAHLGAYEIDFRILFGDEVRWISARGQGSNEGIVGRVMYGAFLDVTQRKQAEEAHELLAGEMSHRVKNLLAIAGALATITSRSTTTTTEMTREFSQRLTALGRAHDLVLPVAGQSSRAALLGDLLAVLLAPYDDKGPSSGRLRISTPKVAVGETAATALALVVHELATNSLKFGALSVKSGILDVSCSTHDGEIAIIWAERGGPSVVAPNKKPTGFGGRMATETMSRHLGGSISFDWSKEGLVATLRAKMDIVAR